jgi:hypothetical protein
VSTWVRWVCTVRGDLPAVPTNERLSLGVDQFSRSGQRTPGLGPDDQNAGQRGNLMLSYLTFSLQQTEFGEPGTVFVEPLLFMAGLGEDQSCLRGVLSRGFLQADNEFGH